MCLFALHGALANNLCLRGNCNYSLTESIGLLSQTSQLITKQESAATTISEDLPLRNPKNWLDSQWPIRKGHTCAALSMMAFLFREDTLCAISAAYLLQGSVKLCNLVETQLRLDQCTPLILWGFVAQCPKTTLGKRWSLEYGNRKTNEYSFFSLMGQAGQIQYFSLSFTIFQNAVMQARKDYAVDSCDLQFQFLHKPHLLCIRRSSSSATLCTTNFWKPAKKFDMNEMCSSLLILPASGRILNESFSVSKCCSSHRLLRHHEAWPYLDGCNLRKCVNQESSV